MGAWETGILDDDVALDLYQDYLEKWDAGVDSPEAIRAALESANAELIADYDDGPVFYLALAKAQWECGVLQPNVLARIEEALADGSLLARWHEADDPDDLSRREEELKQFVEQLRVPSTTPRPGGNIDR